MATGIDHLKLAECPDLSNSLRVSDWKQVGENLVQHKGGTIYLRAKVAGKVVRKSLRTSKLRIAKMKRDAEVDKLREAATAAPSEVVTLGDALELVAKRVVNKPGLKAGTKRYYGQVIENLRKTLPLKLPGGAWTADAAAGWWNRFAAGRSPQKCNNALRLVKMATAVLVESDLRRDDPAAKLRPLKIARAKVDEMPSIDCLDAVVASIRAQGLRCSKDSANMVEFLAWSGLRIGELQTLRWEDVGAEWLTVSGGAKGTKNSRTRRVPINGRLAGVIAGMRYAGARGRVFHILSPRAALVGALKRLKLPHMRIHDLRHWFASHAIEKGVDVLTVSKWLGHLDGGALCMKTYAHLRDEHSLASAGKLG